MGPVFGACLNICNYEMGGAETLSTWVSVLGTHLLLNICYYQNELKEIWVVLKHFQHRSCENLCLEHVCYWTSAVLKHIHHYQKSVWVPETPVGAIQYLFRSSIDALVFKYCQISKQNAISKPVLKYCLKDGLKHWSSIFSLCGTISKHFWTGRWNIFSLCCVKMLISKHFGTKSIEIFSAYLWIISKHLGLGHWNILSPIPSETKHLGLSQPVLCENAYIRTCGIKKLWNIPSQ